MGRVADLVTVPEEIAFIEEVASTLERGRPVRRDLPGGGRLHIDRVLPFLFVYRRPHRSPDPGTERLVRNEASYLVASGDPDRQRFLRSLLRRLLAAMRSRFGAVLLLELWKLEGADVLPENRRSASFRLACSGASPPEEVCEAFAESLRDVRVFQTRSRVETFRSRKVAPHHLPPLVSPREAAADGTHLLGLEVFPVYRGRDSTEVFPLVLGVVHRQLSSALRRAAQQFAACCTSYSPTSHLELGRRKLEPAVFEVDGRLARLVEGFEFLLHVTPIDVEKAWRRFHENGFERAPTFDYRPLPADPVRLKRDLFALPIEAIDDPALMEVFRDKQLEVDRKLTMMIDRDTRRFLPGSLQLYGGVDDDLLELARIVLDRLPADERREGLGGRAHAREVAEAAERELEHYRSLDPGFDGEVRVRDDIYPGLMASRGRLLVGRKTTVPRFRLNALLQHEVGTHLLTYFNGSAQPLQVLRVGLAGYDEFQEGLGVLAEYLAGGLSRSRLRLLAGRVVGARSLTEGASFVETFRLFREYRFRERSAFTMAMRLHRSGGLTKDAIYLRGLAVVLRHLESGHSLEDLLAGKVAPRYLRVLRELELRRVIRRPRLLPRYLTDPEARGRLEKLRRGTTVLDLVEEVA